MKICIQTLKNDECIDEDKLRKGSLSLSYFLLLSQSAADFNTSSVKAWNKMISFLEF